MSLLKASDLQYVLEFGDAYNGRTAIIGVQSRTHFNCHLEGQSAGDSLKYRTHTYDSLKQFEGYYYNKFKSSIDKRKFMKYIVIPDDWYRLGELVLVCPQFTLTTANLVQAPSQDFIPLPQAALAMHSNFTMSEDSTQWSGVKYLSSPASRVMKRTVVIAVPNEDEFTCEVKNRDTTISESYQVSPMTHDQLRDNERPLYKKYTFSFQDYIFPKYIVIKDFDGKLDDKTLNCPDFAVDMKLLRKDTMEFVRFADGAITMVPESPWSTVDKALTANDDGPLASWGLNVAALKYMITEDDRVVIGLSSVHTFSMCMGYDGEVLIDIPTVSKYSDNYTDTSFPMYVVVRNVFHGLETARVLECPGFKVSIRKLKQLASRTFAPLPAESFIPSLKTKDAIVFDDAVRSSLHSMNLWYALSPSEKNVERTAAIAVPLGSNLSCNLKYKSSPELTISEHSTMTYDDVVTNFNGFYSTIPYTLDKRQHTHNFIVVSPTNKDLDFDNMFLQCPEFEVDMTVIDRYPANCFAKLADRTSALLPPDSFKFLPPPLPPHEPAPFTVEASAPLPTHELAPLKIEAPEFDKAAVASSLGACAAFMLALLYCSLPSKASTDDEYTSI